MKRNWVVQGVLEQLSTAGPMTRSEIEEALGLTKNTSGSVMSRMSRASSKMPKRIYVKGYVYDHPGDRRYPRAIYALGDLPDAKKPKPKVKENRKRYDNKIRKLYQSNSVFNLGRTVRQIREMRKAA